MKKIKFLLLLALVAASTFATQVQAALYPVVVGGKWGFIDKYGTLEINHAV